jgi:catechol 2,3-dioxygenase-like lactoylglutathione lyase family enzyme
MKQRLATVNVWVHDQDEAVAFYTQKLGMEVREDVTLAEMGNFRWVSVGHPGQPGVALALMKLMGPPMIDAQAAEKLAEVVGMGIAGGLFFETDDCRGDYEELKARGVEFQEEPTDRPYGIDCAMRDPSGNNIRLVQRNA